MTFAYTLNEDEATATGAAGRRTPVLLEATIRPAAAYEIPPGGTGSSGGGIVMLLDDYGDLREMYASGPRHIPGVTEIA